MSDSDEENPDRQLKIVIMGDGASGKVSHSLTRTQSAVSTLELGMAVGSGVLLISAHDEFGSF